MSPSKRILLAVIATAFLISGPAAFGLTITSPANDAHLPAGPDYATDVLGDPWDMSNPEDIGLDPSETVGWTNFSVNSPSHPGLAGGTTSTYDTQLSLLFRGFYGIINPGKNGRNFPIDTGKYQKLSFRMSSTRANQVMQVYWFHTPWLDPSALPPIGGNGNFGWVLPGYTINGFKIFVVDMTVGNQGVPACAQGVDVCAWTNGVVRGLRLDPNNSDFDQDVFFDWVRLTVADNAPGAAMQRIEWTGGSGTATIDVLDASGTVLNIASGVNSPFNWNYGILPPGAYQLRVTAGSALDTTNFSINNPPIIHVTDPDATGRADYATTVLGNPWDMDSAADIQSTDNITDVSFSNGLLHATNTNNDPIITLLNNAIPIDTTKYRYLTYTMQVDGDFNLGDGSVARVFWDSHQFFNSATATTTKDIIVFPGMNTYTIDLASLTTDPDGGLVTSGGAEAWAPGSKTHFRFDPHEFWAPRTFHIDNVKLAAMAETNHGKFIIRFNGSDEDPGDNPTVTLYYDTDKDPTNGKIQIVSGLALATGQYTWNTASVTPGVYYIYAEVSDGLNTSGLYSRGQLRVIGPGNKISPILMMLLSRAD